MPDAITIPRSDELPVELDWEALRTEGLTHIQRLSGLIWTDHNLHDPGVTILELLSYALTDLGYRAGFDIKDLLARPDGAPEPADVSGLIPAHEVLTTGPRTIVDYRRLLLRIEGIRNAWLDPLTDPTDSFNYRASEIPIYADCAADGLTYAPVSAHGANHPVRLTGLYKVLVELDIDDELGSLNEAGLTFRPQDGALRGATIRFDCFDPAIDNGTLNLGSDLKSIKSVTVTGAGNAFGAEVQVVLEDGTVQILSACSVQVRAERTRPGHAPPKFTDKDVKRLLERADLDAPVSKFWRKLQRRRQTLTTVECALHGHRGLCEDFYSVSTVTPFRIGICADVEVSADADMERIQAEVFHAIENYLSPPVRYCTLEEMLKSGRRPDEIFNEPFRDLEFRCGGQPAFAKPGFITDDTLQETELRRHVRASDIVNLAVDIDGVVAIRDIQLRAYDQSGLALGATDKWSLAVPAGCQPVFFFEGSKLLFHRDGIPYRAQPTEFASTLAYLRAVSRREVYVPPGQTFAVPLGRWRNLDAFHSVANDLPENYGVGRAGIARSAGDERIARARQLKGYLAFFDQLLASYLGQLANARRWLSIDPALTETSGNEVVVDAAPTLGPSFAEEFLIADGSGGESTGRLTGYEERFLERRNRALDHLIARFAERFADYAALMFRKSGDRVQVAEEVVADKLGFLADYPRVSRNRGQAANLRPDKAADVWDCDNISGLERRAGRLLGIDTCLRRNLHAVGHLDSLFQFSGGSGNVRINIADGDGATLFQSDETFADADAAKAAAQKSYAGLRDEGAFEFTQTQGATTYKLRIISGSGTLTHRGKFDTEQDAATAARAIVERYDDLLEAVGEEGEGMHLVEHILLRPRAEGDRLMQICLPDDCQLCGEQDPYSFRVSVVLPYWAGRFRDLNFRALAERMLREEAPAHVQVKICWIGQAQMAEFDAAHRAWLTAIAGNDAGSPAVRTKADRLIAIIDSLKSVYPLASLHDCDAGEDETIVRLGSTALGIY
jgi:hypothetical protein